MASVSDGPNYLSSDGGPAAVTTPQIFYPDSDLDTPKHQPTPPLLSLTPRTVPAWRTSSREVLALPTATPPLPDNSQTGNATVFSTAFQLQLRLLIHSHIQEIQHVCTTLEQRYAQHCAQTSIKFPAMNEYPSTAPTADSEAKCPTFTKAMVVEQEDAVCYEVYSSTSEHDFTSINSERSLVGKTYSRKGPRAGSIGGRGLLQKLRTTNLAESEADKRLSVHSAEHVSKVVKELSAKEERPSFLIINTLVYNVVFDIFCAVMIGLAGLQLGAAVSYSAARPNESPDNLPDVYGISDTIFMIWFILELLLRLAADFGYILHSSETKWNCFDALLVGTDAASRFFRTRNLNMSSIRVLRVLRMAKVLRVVRYIRFFRELRMMVHSIMWSGKPLIWSIFLLIAIIYMFAVFLTMQVTSEYYHNFANPRTDMSLLRKRFGSLRKASLTLYMCVAGGISWVEIADPLMEMHWSNGVVLTFFTFFSIFAVANIITGVFVDSAIHAAQSDRDELIQEQLNEESSSLWKMVKMFQEADTDKSGELTSAELYHHLTDPHVRAHFTAMGLRIDQVPALFRLLDTDNSGSVSIEEFAVGCTRVQGAAKSIDLVTLMQENRRLAEMCNQCFEHVEEKLDKISANVGKDSRPSRRPTRTSDASNGR